MRLKRSRLIRAKLQAPGFSPVEGTSEGESRFNGLYHFGMITGVNAQRPLTPALSPSDGERFRRKEFRALNP